MWYGRYSPEKQDEGYQTEQLNRATGSPRSPCPRVRAVPLPNLQMTPSCARERGEMSRVVKADLDTFETHGDRRRLPSGIARFTELASFHRASSAHVRTHRFGLARLVL